MTFILFAPAKKPSPEHKDTGEGLSDWREIKKTKFTYSSLLQLHAARYSERCGYCRYDRQQYLNDCLPSFTFHFHFISDYLLVITY